MFCSGAGLAVNVCHEVAMPGKQSSSVSGVGSGGLWSTGVAVQRAQNDLGVRDIGSAQTRWC